MSRVKARGDTAAKPRVNESVKPRHQLKMDSAKFAQTRRGYASRAERAPPSPVRATAAAVLTLHLQRFVSLIANNQTRWAID